MAHEESVKKSKRQRVAMFQQPDNRKYRGVVLGILEDAVDAHPLNAGDGQKLLVPNVSGHSYQLLERIRKLGGTGISKVLKVKDKRTGDVMAMKVLKPTSGPDRARAVVANAEAFQREVQMLDLLRSENVYA